ncbi:hypothetical protein BASA50_004009 [Batrachochytrium salamandrivorans]|uniref:PAS domain-containing protein n=1 Tax=Batrachochytrium salamandrivorans TaxID=1357716 RepID=A0ABQ8FGZ6_9FUNG|nr:hypothetical protein BASA50_004009 [Batrachochytrium salamandrivorans]
MAKLKHLARHRHRTRASVHGPTPGELQSAHSSTKKPSLASQERHHQQQLEQEQQLEQVNQTLKEQGKTVTLHPSIAAIYHSVNTPIVIVHPLTDSIVFTNTAFTSQFHIATLLNHSLHDQGPCRPDSSASTLLPQIQHLADTAFAAQSHILGDSNSDGNSNSNSTAQQ